jgi:uncharacterized protein (TIGR03086 family)
MSDVATLYALVASGFSSRVDQISEAQWTAATPHEDWTVRDLVAHTISTQRRVLATLGGPKAVPPDEDGDLGQQWRQASAAMSQALNDPERGSKTIRGLLGAQPFEALVGQLICPDTLVHTWELSRAIGQDPALDPAAMAGATALLAPVDDAVRRPGGLAEKIPSPPGADAQTRFLNFCGQPVPPASSGAPPRPQG